MSPRGAYAPAVSRGREDFYDGQEQMHELAQQQAQGAPESAPMQHATSPHSALMGRPPSTGGQLDVYHAQQPPQPQQPQHASYDNGNGNGFGQPMHHPGYSHSATHDPMQGQLYGQQPTAPQSMQQYLQQQMANPY